MSSKFYTCVAEKLKPKVRKFCGPILTFVEITGEKLLGGLFAPLPPPHPSLIGLNVALVYGTDVVPV